MTNPSTHDKLKGSWSFSTEEGGKEMRIFLIRHGYADDGLTRDGQRQISAAAGYLQALGFDISQVVLLTSELRRAVESAEIIGRTLGFTTEPIRKSWLTSDTDENTTRRLREFVSDNPSLTAVIAVSHMPEIEEALEKFGFYGNVRNGSIHEVDFQANRVTHLFEP